MYLMYLMYLMYSIHVLMYLDYGHLNWKYHGLFITKNTHFTPASDIERKPLSALLLSFFLFRMHKGDGEK